MEVKLYSQVGIMEDNTATTNEYYNSLIKNKDTKFVEKLKTKREANKPGLGFLASEGIFSDNDAWGEDYNNNPISLRIRAIGFGVGIHINNIANGASSGKPHPYITFRPVIWVK